MRKLWKELLWFCILFALILVMAYLLISGEVLLFLAPRMVPMVWFGLIVLIILNIYQAFHIVRSARDRQAKGPFKAGMLLFFVPVLLILTVPPDSGTTGSLPNQNVQMISLATQSEAAAQPADAKQAEPTADSPDATLAPVQSISMEEIAGLPACTLMDETAFFNSEADDFREYLYQSIDELVGKTITVYGFVYEDETFPANTVLVARMMISCCAADASIVGFHVKLDGATDLEKNEWIRVTGTVRSFSMPYYGTTYDFPILTDGIILRCDAPDVEDAYIYP